MRMWALPKDGRGPRRELKIEELWPHKGYLILKFEGVGSMTEAETLIGCELQVPASERSKLEPGWFYVSDLVGCRVLDGESEIGSVADVQFGAGEAPLLIVKAGSKEYEIPYAEAYLKSTDLEHKRIYMMLPEGMLELNAPLTAEEKEQQKISNKKVSS
jgi:16S rRNA processing protein RimM